MAASRSGHFGKCVNTVYLKINFCVIIAGLQQLSISSCVGMRGLEPVHASAIAFLATSAMER